MRIFLASVFFFSIHNSSIDLSFVELKLKTESFRTSYLTIRLITGRDGSRLVTRNHEGRPFASLRRHVPSTPMLAVDAELSFRWRARIVAAPACVHFFYQSVSIACLIS